MRRERGLAGCGGVGSVVLFAAVGMGDGLVAEREGLRIEAGQAGIAAGWICK